MVVLEQGPRLYPSDFEHDELKNWFIGGLVDQSAAAIRRAFRRSASETAAAPLVRPPLWYARGVGGTTLHYTANYWRFREIDFRERSVLGAISGTGFADWPITLRGARALLHEGRLGDRRLRPGRRRSRSIRRAAARIPCRRCA